MRTTVTLDPDVHRLLLDAAHRRGEPFKRVLNDAVRSGLKGAGSGKATPFKQRSFRLGKSLVDLTKATALAADLEDAEQARGLERRR